MHYFQTHAEINMECTTEPGAGTTHALPPIRIGPSSFCSASQPVGSEVVLLLELHCLSGAAGHTHAHVLGQHASVALNQPRAFRWLFGCGAFRAAVPVHSLSWAASSPEGPKQQHMHSGTRRDAAAAVDHSPRTCWLLRCWTVWRCCAGVAGALWLPIGCWMSRGSAANLLAACGVCVGCSHLFPQCLAVPQQQCRNVHDAICPCLTVTSCSPSLRTSCARAF